jgi:hypothetical protein
LVAAINTAIIAVIMIISQTANLHKVINGGFSTFGLVRCVGILLYLVVVDETTFCCRDEVVKLSDKGEHHQADREERTAERQPCGTEIERRTMRVRVLKDHRKTWLFDRKS